MKPISFVSGVTIALFIVTATPARADSSAQYLRPALKTGERITDVFSKTVSIKGQGFDEYVGRIAGSGNATITRIIPKAISFSQTYRYDGYASGAGNSEILSDQMTICFQGKCRIDDETSGVLFNPLLWGPVPDEIHVGTSWKVTISKPWEIGPSGTEQVRVLRLDPLNHVITLLREGMGSGTSSDDLARQQSGKPLSITVAGKKIDVSLIPGASRWSGTTTVCRGVILSDEIMVERQVTLVSKTGRKFVGEQRSYTLLNYSQDAA